MTHDTPDLVHETVADEWRTQRARFPTVIILYESHADYPGLWLLRAWQERSCTHHVKLRYAVAHGTREQACAWVAQNLPDFEPLSPMPGDDPAIVMTWI